MAPIKCIFFEDTKRDRMSLRRYSQFRCDANPAGSHNGLVTIGEAPEGGVSGDSHPHDDPRWPKKCDTCDYLFTEKDSWQLFHRSIYKCAETGQELVIDDFPVGAMWFRECGYTGPDFPLNLIVKCPTGRHWNVDSIASNCTRRDDTVHKCWVRHGSPPNVHVDKNGNTCNAGAGSIQFPGWHGFLTNGYLQEQR